MRCSKETVGEEKEEEKGKEIVEEEEEIIRSAVWRRVR